MESQGIIKNISKNVSSLRKERNLTQAQLSKISGVPRSTITNIESGDSNPTVFVLEKLAKGLQIGVEELMLKPREQTLLIKAKDVPIDSRSGGKAQLHKLLPDEIPGMEIDRLALEPNSRMKGVPHVARTKEYLTCVKGKVEVYTDGERFLLNPGDVLAFPGDRPHSYYNPTAKRAECISVVVIAYL